ncbi:hypothetical protein BDV41DRAFT_532052 [Aspergillus transmontanensis]|uniref:Uncharacterized protein n=1 Tax=Aspergillus transmontanensis TaxID=1034304 RepID=A0A5N6W3R2_9EURO|nr:hypothetical protein BDV41DRAFT_532052 [Aspergillus transmontanensis]
MTNKCSATVSKPPTGLWNSTEVVAFPDDHKYLLAQQACCGETNQIQLYKKNCFRFCSTYGNQSNVTSCLEDRGVKKVAEFHNDKGGQSMSPHQLSKPAHGLAFMVLMGYLMGPLGEALLAA